MLFWVLVSACPLPAQQVYVTTDLSGNMLQLSGANAPALGILRQPVSQVAAVGDGVAFSVIAQGPMPLSYQWQLNTTNIPGASSDSLTLTNVAVTDFGTYRVMITSGASSLTSSNALFQLDSDHDGMADAWEIAEFGNITNRPGFTDYDGDGVSDRDEFLAGTDPKNYSSSHPLLTVYSDNGVVLVTPDVPFFTNGQTITLTGTPNPGLQFLAYLGEPDGGGPVYHLQPNPASFRFGSPGINGSQTVRAIFGLPLAQALNVTNGWKIDQAGWYGETNISHDGFAAAQSARSINGNDAWLDLTNVFLSSEGTISFWWKVDGTPDDQLEFARNNFVRSGAIGTNTDWQYKTYYLPAGMNDVRWIYHKGGNQVSEYNGLVYAPLDAGWVDEVTYAPWADPTLDTDGDGLPDIWEYKYYDSLGQGAHDDPDHDGNDNLTEYLDGTDPTSNASMLPRLTVLANGGSVTVTPNLPKYTLNQLIQLQAVPDSTNYFVIWQGALSGTSASNSLYMNGNKSVTAIFGLPLGYVLDAPALAWTRGGSIGFFGQTNFSYDGLHSAQSGPVGFNQESTMETTVSGPGTLIFWWKVDCNSNLSYGRFFLDGVEQPVAITGDIPWTPESFSVGAGTHTLHWSYTNRVIQTSLTNGVWVDRVFYSSSNVAPTIVVQPTDVLAPLGATIQFQVGVTGTPPFTYQWFRNGASLGVGGSNGTLSLTNVALAQAGTYSVTVGNSVTSTMSSTAKLTVVPVPPVNDNFANRSALAGTNSVLGYTFGATKEFNEPYHAGIYGGHSVWWTWTAPFTGTFTLNAAGTNLSPLVAAVYTGSAVDALTGIGSGTGSLFMTNGVAVSALSFNFLATNGITYAIAADHGGFQDGFFTLAITPVQKMALSNINLSAGGTFGFQFRAAPGASYAIEASVDLEIWEAVTNGIVPLGGVIEFSAPFKTSSRPEFYRVLMQ